MHEKLELILSMNSVAVKSTDVFNNSLNKGWLSSILCEELFLLGFKTFLVKWEGYLTE